MVTAALAVTAMATPAEAQRWGGRHHYRGHDHVSLGEALLGAILVGGVVAAASADSRAREREREEVVYDTPPPPPPTEYREADPAQPDAAAGFDGRYDEEGAADACAQAAQFTGQRYAKIARVMGIDDVSGSGTNWLVRGHLDLAETWRSARKGYDFRCTLGGGKEPDVVIEGLATAN
jgi:hypothetical protein